MIPFPIGENSADSAGESLSLFIGLGPAEDSESDFSVASVILGISDRERWSFCYRDCYLGPLDPTGSETFRTSRSC